MKQYTYLDAQKLASNIINEKESKKYCELTKASYNVNGRNLDKLLNSNQIVILGKLITYLQAKNETENQPKDLNLKTQFDVGAQFDVGDLFNSNDGTLKEDVIEFIKKYDENSEVLKTYYEIQNINDIYLIGNLYARKDILKAKGDGALLLGSISPLNKEKIKEAIASDDKKMNPTIAAFNNLNPDKQVERAARLATDKGGFINYGIDNYFSYCFLVLTFIYNKYLTFDTQTTQGDKQKREAAALEAGIIQLMQGETFDIEEFNSKTLEDKERLIQQTSAYSKIIEKPYNLFIKRTKTLEVFNEIFTDTEEAGKNLIKVKNNIIANLNFKNNYSALFNVKNFDIEPYKAKLQSVKRRTDLTKQQRDLLEAAFEKAELFKNALEKNESEIKPFYSKADIQKLQELGITEGLNTCATNKEGLSAELQSLVEKGLSAELQSLVENIKDINNINNVFICLDKLSTPGILYGHTYEFTNHMENILTTVAGLEVQGQPQLPIHTSEVSENKAEFLDPKNQSHNTHEEEQPSRTKSYAEKLKKEQEDQIQDRGQDRN